MKLIFEKDGERIEIEKNSKNHMLQIADYVKNGYTYIQTQDEEQKIEEQPTVENIETPIIEEPKNEKINQKKVIFTRRQNLRFVEFGVATYLHFYIIALTLSYVESLLPRHITRGSVGEILNLAIFIITIITLINVIKNRQFKIVIINYFIISVFVYAGLYFADFLSYFMPFGEFISMILLFIVYVIHLTIVYDMSNHVNLATMKEYIRDGYEIKNADELTEEEITDITVINHVKPFWQIVG